MRATLTYHSVDDSGSPISISRDAFNAHLRWLTSGKVRVVPLDALSADAGADDALALTFDDGCLNTKDGVEQLLAAGLPVTLFVVTRHVGATNAWGGHEPPGIPTLPLLSWTDLEQLAAKGASLASHTRTHPRLTELSASALEDELLGSQADLQEHVGTRAVHLAYPYGDVNEAVAAAASRQYRWGHTTDFRGRAAEDAPLLLPRLDAYYFRAPGQLETWGTPAFERRVAWCRARRWVRETLVAR